MRKLMLGAVLLAAMLPVTTVYAAGEGTAKTNYTKNKASKTAKQNAEDAIAAGIANGLTVEEAMAEIIEIDSDNAPVAVAAAIKADPTNAGPLTKLAISKAPLLGSAITSAALRAVTTPEARAEVAAAAKDKGVPAATVNALVADALKSPSTPTPPENTPTPPKDKTLDVVGFTGGPAAGSGTGSTGAGGTGSGGGGKASGS